jgi:hypothetical protein
MFYKQIQQSQNYNIYGNLKFLFPLSMEAFAEFSLDFPPNSKTFIFNISQWSFEVEILFENVKIDFQICQILGRGYHRRPVVAHAQQQAKIKASMCI